jgi:hypothetical protein
MFERSELHSRREEREENGVKNLIGSEAIPEYFPITTHPEWKKNNQVDTRYHVIFLSSFVSICMLNWTVILEYLFS